MSTGRIKIAANLTTLALFAMIIICVSNPAVWPRWLLYTLVVTLALTQIVFLRLFVVETKRKLEFKERDRAA